ncbi:MAG: hypothetical protein AAFU65_01385 [Pseudomonadota bacterium]
MPLEIAPEPTPPRLRDLRMVDQLFLWTVRHVVCAAEDGAPVNARLEDFFRDAGLPRVVALTVALLRTLSAVATEAMTVNVPCGVQVLDDEYALLADLHRNAGHVHGLSALRRKVDGAGSAIVAQRLHALAAQFDALDAMRGRRAPRTMLVH